MASYHSKVLLNLKKSYVESMTIEKYLCNIFLITKKNNDKNEVKV